MKIDYYDILPSTQKFLIEGLKNSSLQASICVVAKEQSSGFGSRGNHWISEKGNLFFSFAISKNSLPSDLKLESTSIYVSYILKEVLSQEGSKIWLKWPNDFYLGDKKVGGCITSVVGENIVCGIGLNLTFSNEVYSCCDITISVEKILNHYFENLEKFISWKHVFSNFKIEFDKSKKFVTNFAQTKININETSLNEDGSLMYKNERIYSLR